MTLPEPPEYPELPDATHHVAAEIPDYALGRLPPALAATVREHLAGCVACAEELRAWQRIAAAERRAEAAIPAPAPDILARVFAEIEAAPVPVPAPAVSVPAGQRRSVALLTHAWRVFGAQRRLLRRSMWVASAVGIALAAVYAGVVGQVALVPDVLAFALPLIAAAGMAFLYGPDNDPSLELALATQTSPRAVLLSRFALLFGFDTALALVATLTLALSYGSGFWPFAAAWFGPMALLSALSLALSLAFGPLTALAASGGLWLTRVIDFSDGMRIHVAPDAFWQTTPQILFVALVLLVCAVIAATRLERLPDWG